MSQGSLGSLMNFKRGKESSKRLRCDIKQQRIHFLSLFLSLPPFKSSIIHRKWKGLVFDHGTICQVVKAILKNTTYNICSQKSLFKIWRVWGFFFSPLSFPHFHQECKRVDWFFICFEFLVAAVRKSMWRQQQSLASLRCCNTAEKELCHIHEQVLVGY